MKEEERGGREGGGERGGGRGERGGSMLIVQCVLWNKTHVLYFCKLDGYICVDCSFNRRLFSPTAHSGLQLGLKLGVRIIVRVKVTLDQ